MTKDSLIHGGLPRPGRRVGRPWRPWFWGLAAWLINGGIAAAFYLTLRTGTTLGYLVPVAFITGFLLKQVLEATSQGD